MVLTLWICPPFSEGERDCSSRSSVHSPCELEEGLEGVKVEWGSGGGEVYQNCHSSCFHLP